MISFLSKKAVRLLLVFSVSTWMAGGCLLGCSNTSLAANGNHETVSDARTIVAGHNCHAMLSDSKAPKGVPSFAPDPIGMMKDCLLAVSATAVTTKSSGQMPDPGLGPVSSLPFIRNGTVQLAGASLIPIPPNRGPTYLRCCVLLI
jgi:hypothetical protein